MPQLSSLLLAAWLSTSSASPAAGPTDTEAIASVDAAIGLANDDPRAGAERLERALADLERSPGVLLADPAARKMRARALLTLARARLAVEDLEGANAALDEAIRTYEDTLDVQAFGPTLAELFEQRIRALSEASTVTIEVRCAVPCRLFVNERPAEGSIREVYPGRYRVHVEGLDPGEATPLDTALVVEAATTLDWPAPTATAPVDPRPAPSRQDRKRLLPRWAEAVILGAGAAAVGAGAALMAIDGRCPKGNDPGDAAACPQVYTTTAPGIGALAAGAAVFATGGVLLTVDEVRVGRNRGRTVSVGFHLYF